MSDSTTDDELRRMLDDHESDVESVAFDAACEILEAAPEIIAELLALRAREAGWQAELIAAERMLVKVAATLPSSVVQKLPTKLLMEWEQVETNARAALSHTAREDYPHD